MRHADPGRLSDYLDGELGAAERAELESHVDGCARCRQELGALRSTVGLLRSLPEPEPPASLVADVMARLAKQSPARAARAPSGGTLAITALAAGLAAAALLVDLPQAPQPVPSAAPEGPALRRASRPAAERLALGLPPLPPSRRSLLSQRGVDFAGLDSAPSFFRDEGPEVLESPELEMDRQLELLLVDPDAFLRRLGPDARGDRFTRLVYHAAQRGEAAQAAQRLMAVPHPVANDLVSRLIAASLAADFESRLNPR